MTSFNAWDVVSVPFPYTDRHVRQRRPALVIAADKLQADHGLLWLLMITSAENRKWPGDVPVSDLKAAGLPAASVVRPAKIAAIDALQAQYLGVLPAKDRKAVISYVSKTLASVL